MNEDTDYGECPWRDESILRDLYHHQGMTQAEIAEKFGCTKPTISKWMGKHGIETRRGLISELRDRDWLYEQYVEKGMSAMEIADELGCSEYPVFYWLDNHDIETRKSSREQYHTPTLDDRGYERIHTTPYEGKDKVKHHRLIAVAEYGMSEVKEKEVHHLNGIPWDNRRSNLTLLEKDEHARRHAENRTRNECGQFTN